MVIYLKASEQTTYSDMSNELLLFTSQRKIQDYNSFGYKGNLDF
jgi:hypothetical protein